MKTTILYPCMLLFILTMTISSCSKKNMTTVRSELYKEYNQNSGIEQIASNVSAGATASEGAEKTNLFQEKTQISSDLKNFPSSSTNNVSDKKEVKSVKQSLMTKILLRKIEKSLKKQQAAAPHEASGPLRTGIILGAVGLLLLITAGFFGPASPLIYVSGAVLFVVGVVIILISVL